jgi:hypothetical protein
MTNPEPQTLELSQRVRQSSRQAHCLLGEVFVLMDSVSGEYFELNRVGSQLWRKAASPTSIAILVSDMVRDYEVDASTCEAQVQAWIEKMVSLGFLERVAD